jgi:hypothetical protein
MDYIKEGQLPSRAPNLISTNTKCRAPYLIPKQDVGFATLATQTCINLVSRVLAHTFEFSVSRSRSSQHILLPRVPP